MRNAIREDLLFFGLPAILVYTAGLVVSALDGRVGLVTTIGNLIGKPRSIPMLSLPNLVGIALIVVGFAILLIAYITLGRFYSSTLEIRKDHQLIRHGIYHYTRHPIYLGTLIVCIGIPVFTSSVYGLLTMSALIPVFLIRIKMEERMLTGAFGDDYRRYKESTSKLIPFIY